MRYLTLLVCFLAWKAQAADPFEQISLSHSGKLVAIQNADGSASVLDIYSGSKKMLSKANRQNMTFVWSPDNKYIVATSGGEITGYSASSGHIFKSLAGSSPASLVDVSPDGKYISFIRDNNLWVYSMAAGVVKPLTGGASNNLLIGAPDFVYGQEFDVSRHYWWSPDSTSIAYIETEFSDSDHYVIPGAKLPKFRLKVLDVTTAQSRLVMESDDQWSYLLRVAWHPSSKRLVFYRMNRVQNLAELCSFDDGLVNTLLTEKDDYWVNVPETPVFVDDGKRIVVSSERSGARHVYLYELSGQLVRDLTPPDLEVYHLHSTQDPNAGHVYVTGSTGNRQEQNLFCLNLDGTPPRRLTSETGWHEVSLDSKGDSYLDCHSSAMKAPSVEWHGAGEKRRVVVSSSTNEKPVANEFMTISTHDNVQLPARLFKPDDFNPQKKYPLIIYTFSGPRGRVVQDSWGGWQMAWNRSMVGQGYLVLALDVRGSGGYGHLFEEYIHYRFGAQETADIREVVSYLRRQSYVDGDRLGIWGVDYGAQTVIHAMWQFPGGFKAGFADSPIADWKKYDAYFTERYLGLPAKRMNEYNDSTALEDARRMTGTLLVVSRPDHHLIRPDQVEALQKAMSQVKRDKEVIKRFHVIAAPAGVEELMVQMTRFFTQTL